MKLNFLKKLNTKVVVLIVVAVVLVIGGGTALALSSGQKKRGDQRTGGENSRLCPCRGFGKRHSCAEGE